MRVKDVIELKVSNQSEPLALLNLLAMGKVGESGAAAEDSPLIRALALQSDPCDSTGSLRGSGTALQFILRASDWTACGTVAVRLQ